MKNVRISKKDYDDLVYPAVALAVHDATVASIRMCDKVLNKLEAKGTQLPPADRSLWGPGQTEAPPPLYVMDGVSAEFEFEDAEANYLVGKMLDLNAQLQGRRTRAMVPIIDALEKEPMDDIGIRPTADRKSAAAG